MSGDFMRDLAAQRAADEATERLLATVHAAGVVAGIAWATEAQRYREGRVLEVPPMPTYTPTRETR